MIPLFNFFMKGSNTEIILDVNSLNENHLNVETWALWQRNQKYSPEDAGRIVFEATKGLKRKIWH